MGFFDLFRPTKKRVTKEEFRLALSRLRSQGFTPREIAYVENIFAGSQIEDRTYDKGIDSKEIVETLSIARKNIRKENILSEKQIKLLEEALLRKL